MLVSLAGMTTALAGTSQFRWDDRTDRARWRLVTAHLKVVSSGVSTPGRGVAHFPKE